MGLEQITTTIKDALTQLPNLDEVTDAVPPGLVNARTAVVYALPGLMVPHSHASRNGRPTFRCSDIIVVEVLFKVQADHYGEVERDSRPVLDGVRMALGATLLGPSLTGVIVALRGIDVTDYGDFELGTDRAFGFRLSVDIDHILEAE